MESISGIQIIGTQRSGSNLLRVILDQSTEIASPHPPHILVTFMPLMPLYGELNAVSYKRLVDDVADYVLANPVPWEGVILDKDKIMQDSRHYSLAELNRLIYEAAAEAKKSKYWCCKSMANVHYANELEEAGLNLKYIFLYRDGRDVAASFKKAVVGEKHIYHLAKQWKHDQDACIRLGEMMGEDRFYRLNYESLISDPEGSVKSLCYFLGIEYVKSMMSFYESRTSKLAAEAGEMWSNLKKPIIKDNTGKYMQTFSGNDLQIFEAVAGDVLCKLGYRLESGIDLRDHAGLRHELLSEENLKEYNRINTILKKETIQQASKADLDNRRPQELVLERIKNRDSILFNQDN